MTACEFANWNPRGFAAPDVAIFDPHILDLLREQHPFHTRMMEVNAATVKHAHRMPAMFIDGDAGNLNVRGPMRPFADGNAYPFTPWDRDGPCRPLIKRTFSLL